MFERFTTQARRVIVTAQDEARGLQHNYIGTEHLLLGLLGVHEGVASRALTGLGITIEGTRDEVRAIIGEGSQAPSGRIPFTPRAKKVLELSLREALQLRHAYIGTEHILLGLVREGDGVAAQILDQHTDRNAIRMAVIELLPGVSAETMHGRRWLWRRSGAEPPAYGDAAYGNAASEDVASGNSLLNATPAADTTLSEAARLAGPQPVGSHHLLLAALADADSAAARALAALGVDLDQARETLRGMEVTGTSDEPAEEAGRRQLVIRVSDDRLIIETSDPVLVGAGRAALGALGEAETGGSIRGDRPECASLAAVWQAVHDSLQAIGRRAGS